MDYHIPAAGRRVLGREAIRLFDSLVERVERYTYRDLHASEKSGLRSLGDSIEDQSELIEKLRDEGMAVFIANGSRLVDEGEVVLFKTPDSLSVEYELVL